MALDYIETSKQIAEAVGGVDNIASATHCMTRLRLVLKDEGKANDDAVKGIKGVKSVIKQGGQYQVVIGNEVSNLFKEFKKLGNFGDEGSAPAPVKAQGNALQRLFGFVAGCLTPLLPAMLGTGMVKVLLVLLTTIGVMDSTGPTYTILFSMADSFFYMLPVMLGWSIAKKTGHSVPLYMVIGAMLCYPDLITLLGGGSEVARYGVFLGQNCTYIFGVIPVVGASYTSSVLPMLLMTPVMGWAEDFADRVSPNVLKAFLKPMLFLLICTPIMLVVLGPLGAILGNVLAAGITALYNAVPWLTVPILSAAMPFIVMTGMHYALIPLAINNFAVLGYDVVVIITMFCSNICQGAASLGVALKTKDTEIKSEGIACAISAIVAGVTEPAMYGINMRFVKPMIGAVAGAAASGLVCGLFGVKGYTMGGSPSILTLINMIGGPNPYHGVIWGAIAAVIGIAVAVAVTFVLYKDEDNA
jgi:PTS system beta-glucosides-specific IIC component